MVQKSHRTHLCNGGCGTRIGIRADYCPTCGEKRRQHQREEQERWRKGWRRISAGLYTSADGNRTIAWYDKKSAKYGWILQVEGVNATYLFPTKAAAQRGVGGRRLAGCPL